MGRQIQPGGCGLLDATPLVLASVTDVQQLLETLEGSEVCTGNSDPQFSVLHPNSRIHQVLICLYHRFYRIHFCISCI